MPDRLQRILTLAGVLFVLAAAPGAPALAQITTGGVTMKLEVTSPAFTEGGMIPSKYTCEGADVSPPLNIKGIPEGTKSIALIADDPDAPRGIWIHWVLYDWPPEMLSIPENVPKAAELPNGAKQGMTDFGRPGYGGPCPPSGTHRYYFKVYALDKKIDKPAGLTKAQLLEEMKGHVLAEGVLMGRYARR